MTEVALTSLSRNDPHYTPKYVPTCVYTKKKSTNHRQTYAVVVQESTSDNSRRKHGHLLGPNISMQILDPNHVNKNRQTFPAARLTFVTQSGSDTHNTKASEGGFTWRWCNPYTECRSPCTIAAYTCSHRVEWLRVPAEYVLVRRCTPEALCLVSSAWCTRCAVRRQDA